VIFSGVLFPPEILEAIENGRLVIFAGAGVSVGPPALLPSFWKLATDLAEGTGQSPCDPLDKFIGLLPLDDHALRKKTANIIGSSTRHTPLHTGLLRTFSCVEQVKVVTTNFDTLFECASTQIWEKLPAVYTAPALPLGSRFEGIVHIHGALDPVDSIVLTDSDFGRAYLTEGWARRFLVDLFEHYTVLFVGYSHDDAVLQYLARALPDKAQGKRFSLVGALDNPEKWFPLGVGAIEFNQSDSGDFSSLNSAVAELADFANRKPSDWQDLIGDIASNLPDKMDIEDEATLRHALKDLSKVRFFVKHAKSPKWTNWLDRESIFDELFGHEEPSKSAQAIAHWLNEHVVSEEPDRVICLMAEHHFIVGAWYWWSLANHVSSLESGKYFDKFLNILLQVKPSNIDVHALHFLAEKSHRLGMFLPTLQIFELMATSRVFIREYVESQEEARDFSIRGEVSMVSPEWNLNEIWTKCLSPNIEAEYFSMLKATERLLSMRYNQMKIWGEASSEFDGDSFRRSAIASHEQDNHREALDVIIDAARDCLEKMASKSPEEAIYWIKSFKSSPPQLLQRIAIHSICFLGVTPDKKAELVLDFGLLHSAWKREAFSFVEGNYAELSDTCRQNLIDEVLTYQSSSDEHMEVRTANEHIQWFKVMQNADNNCDLVKAVIKKIESIHGELVLQRYPGLRFWTETGRETGTGRDHSPWTVAELLENEYEDWFSELYSYDGGDSFREPNRPGLLKSIEGAAREKRDWLFKFSSYLVGQEHWGSDIWPYLLRALENWPLTKDETTEYFVLFSNDPLLETHPREISSILVSAVANRGVPYICEILEQTNKIAIDLWGSISVSKNPLVQREVDWVGSSINSVEGRIATYWIYALDASNRCGTRELCEPYKAEIRRMCETSDEKTAFTIPVITRQIAFLTSLDKNWTEQFIYPLFSCSDDRRASQAWHGFLGSRGPSDIVFNSLKNAFGYAISRLAVIMQGKEERFIEFYAYIALFKLTSPQKEWIPSLLLVLPDSLKTVFSKKIGSLLRTMKHADIDKVWKTWLKAYWQDRIDGAPVPLSDQDSRAMLEWLPYLDNNFPEAVCLAVKMAKPKLEHCLFFRHIMSMEISKRWPDDVVTLIIYILSCDQESWSLNNLDDLLMKIPFDEVDSKVLSGLNEALIASGRDSLNLNQSNEIGCKSNS